MHVRPALLLVTLLLLAPVSDASTPVVRNVWTVFTTVDAVVEENYARVKVIADIGNRGPDPEFPFVVRIPDDAFVTGLLIERDGVAHEALVKDREAARAEYEEWKSQQQTGGLVEKTRRTSVYAYLVNVAEFTSVRATLTYERYLAAERGVHALALEAPVSGFGEDLGARFHVRVLHDDGVVSLWGEPNGRVDGTTITHEVGPRRGVESPTRFNVSYALAPTGDAGSLLTTIVNGTGYFAHRFRAPADAAQLPMDLVLVLDVSGSMAGLKLQQMVDAAKQVVGSLDERDRLHLVAFSSDARSAWRGMNEMTPEARRQAAREIESLFDGGGTNIEAGLREGFRALAALDPSRAERFPALVLLTDGQPTSGDTTRAGLLALAKRANEQGAHVFGIAFGADADWGLVRTLAEDANGAAIRVPLGQGAEVDLRRFMAALTTPVLRDVSIAYGPGVVAHRAGAPVLFAGSELLVTGTFDPERGIQGTVSGVSPEGARRYDFAGGASAPLPFLPRLVAYQEVLAQERSDAPDVARIKTLALAHGFVTDHTSLVLTLPARELRAWEDVRAGSADDASKAAAPPMAGHNSVRSLPFGTGAAPEAYQVTGLQADATSDPTVAPSSAPPPTPESAAVPGAGAALLVAALGLVALVARRRA